MDCRLWIPIWEFGDPRENFDFWKSKIAMLKSLWLGRLALSCGVQARGSNGVNPTWLGFSYGSWWPRARVQRNPRYVPSVSVYWLCFHVVADLWPKGAGNWGLL